MAAVALPALCSCMSHTFNTEVVCVQGKKVVDLPPVTEHEVQVDVSEADAAIIPLVRPCSHFPRSHCVLQS